MQKAFEDGAENILNQIYLGCSFPYTCQVPNETSTDRRIEAGWERGRWIEGGQMDRLDSGGARQDALYNTTKCQRTPHACSKFIVTKGRRGAWQSENGKCQNE